jgi:phosphoserine phosphatase RsbU/P
MLQEESAWLEVHGPGGGVRKVALVGPVFAIGRQEGNSLTLADNRISRRHAELYLDGSDWKVRDLGSRQGTWVNGSNEAEATLNDLARISFGLEDSYQLVFRRAVQGEAVSGQFSRLRALIEVARTLQSAVPLEQVFAAIIDAALAITNGEKGFLLLEERGELCLRAARNREGEALEEDSPGISRSELRARLLGRAEVLRMAHGEEVSTGARHALAVPLLRMRAGHVEETRLLTLADTSGVLLLEGRAFRAQLSEDNQEWLQTLAIELSTALENARLLAEERLRIQLDEELRLARDIQQTLLPENLPCFGWIRAAGFSLPTRQIGGDFFDLHRTGAGWLALMGDVSGKGASAALLASLIQGSFVDPPASVAALLEHLHRLNEFLVLRAEATKYATIFAALLQPDGLFSYVNAAHPRPWVLQKNGIVESLGESSQPVGLLEQVSYSVATRQLQARDRVVIFSDGVEDATNETGERYGRKRLKQFLQLHGDTECGVLHERIRQQLQQWCGERDRADDITVLVLEYAGQA